MCLALPGPPAKPDPAAPERRPPGALVIFVGGLILLAIFSLAAVTARWRQH